MMMDNDTPTVQSTPASHISPQRNEPTASAACTSGAATSSTSTPMLNLNDETPVTRKRACQESQWKRVKPKIARQKGKGYISPHNGKEYPAKTVIPLRASHTTCKQHCARFFDSKDQQCLLEEYWRMDKNVKDQYLSSLIKQEVPINQRRRSSFKNKRKVSQKYYLPKEGRSIHVCREFFLSTFGISHSRIETIRKHLKALGNPVEHVHSPPVNKMTDATLATIRDHINSFPKVESHYCRADTKRQYLDPNLSIAKMYDTYQQAMAGKPDIAPASKFKYYEIFNNEFNLGFHKPKKDVCDKCKEFDVGELTEEKIHAKETHRQGIRETADQRHYDAAITEPSQLVVSFDMENIFALPRTNVSVAFYKRKLNAINLTARVLRTTKGYCALWTENISGRTGNDLASALVLLLKQIIQDHPEASDLILWSDSCVAQNRNQMMSYALQNLIETTPQLKSIVQRYCEPGHSNIQDVDNLHSVIERNLKSAEIMSPITLVRRLKAITPGKIPMYVHMLNDNDFFDFGALSKAGSYNKVGYTSAKEIKYTAANIDSLQIKRAFTAESVTVPVLKVRRLRNGNVKPLSKPNPLKTKVDLSDAKRKDIQSMLRFMDGDDLIYMSNIVKQ